MGEIKSVKVDNWGVFFLQKLQNFFNKTDYCDLTLQFRDNSQLKVHRLVLSACTDFFNVLEQTCEMVDDALIMPNELQADVVVPIVNFMYTGTLEFELKMYGKLLRTAKEMNMTVLLKLLEAHRRTMEGVNRANRPPSPKSVRRRPTMATTVGSSLQQQVSQQRRVLTSPNTMSQSQRRIVQTKTMTTNTGPSTSTPVSQVQYRQQLSATSFAKPVVGNNSTTTGSTQMRAQYGNVTVYETAVKQEPDEQIPTSPFEQLRKGYNNNKRPATSTFISPPSKKLNIEDVKEFAEQQRMRKQIAAEYGEDHGEYDNSIMDDDIHNDDDDDDVAMPSMPTTSSAQASTSRQTQLQHGATTITINQNEKPPTIVVKDSSNSKMNHAKIIKEVLRQYPHLVKSNKNIKLKIMPNVGDQPQKIIVKKEQSENISSDIARSSGMQQQPQQSVVMRTQTSPQTLLKPQEKSSTNNQLQSQTQLVSSKVPVQQKTVVSTSPQASSTVVPAQKRRIDSKTMHALIALGAENTSGPWLCLRCGVNGRPISIPSYRGFRRHLINTHKETIDPALCEHCGLRSSNNRELHYHTEVEHNVKTTSYTFPECLLCGQKFLNTNTLNQHMVEAHPDENKQQCIYCNKIFAREMQLYTHMKTYHKKQALEDGIIDYSDEEFPGSQDETEIEQQPQPQNQVLKEKKDTKIKILSDISLPSAGTILKLEPVSEAANLNNVSSAIVTNMGIANAQEYMEPHGGAVVTAETKFVNVDGNEMLLTEEQRKEIMLQLNQEHGTGGVVMVLNEPTEFTTESVTEQATMGSQDIEKGAETAAADTTGEASAAEEDFDDSQIFNEFNTQSNNSGTSEVGRITSGAENVEVEPTFEKKNSSNTLDESKESVENLEWAENLISAHELADEAMEETEKKDDALNQKLKELTGDWSEDENEDEQPEQLSAENIDPKSSEKIESINIMKNEDVENQEVSADKGKECEKEIEQESKVDIKDILEDKNTIDSSEADKAADADDCKNDDDVDMLMKNLHKDDTSDATKPDEKENEEKSAVSKDKSSENIKERNISPILEKQKETEAAINPSDEFKSKHASKVKKEDENEAGTDNVEHVGLLAELLDKTDCIKDEQEFLPEEKSESLKSIDAINPTSAVDDEKKPILSAEPMETDVDEEPTAASTDAAKGNVAEKKIDKSETADRVKSLISEWGDDEDEADVEQL